MVEPITVFVCATANGIKPVLLLEEMGLEYRCKVVDLVGGEHRSAALLAHNRVGKVPMMLDPDGPEGAPISLGESGAMASYLVRKTGLLGGATDRERAWVDYWSQVANATVAAATARLFWLSHLAPQKVPELIAAAHDDCLRFFQVVEDHLTDERDWLVGDGFSAADALMWPHCHYSATMLDGGLAPFPALQAYCDRMLQRPTVQRAIAAVG